jgi:GntR family transcriptional regulator
VSYAAEKPPEDIEQDFSLADGTLPMRMERIYLKNEQPIALGVSWMAPAMSAIPQSELAEISTLRAIEKHIGSVDRVDYAIRSISAGEELADKLDLAVGSPLLQIRKKSQAANGQCLEIAVAVLDAGVYEFTFTNNRSASVKGRLRPVEAAAKEHTRERKLP